MHRIDFLSYVVKIRKGYQNVKEKLLNLFSLNFLQLYCDNKLDTIRLCPQHYSCPE